MGPQIRYCTTNDGVRIAYSVSGVGPLLLWAPDLPNSHVSLEWQQPGIGQQLARLAAQFTLVRYDARGVGLSDRDVSDFSLEARRRDLEAVIASFGAAQIILMGIEWSGPLVISYAADHPAAVSHLVLLDTFARSHDFAEHARNKLSMKLLDGDWEMFVDSRITLAGEIGSRVGGAYGDFYRACVSQQTAQLMFPQLAMDDASYALAAVSTPTLIIQHEALKNRTSDMAKTLAAGIAGSRLVIVPGGLFEETSAVVSSITSFIKGESLIQGSGSTRVILFTDIADSTRLTERMGDAAFRAAARDLDGAVRAAIRVHGGTPVEGKVLGDGVMGVFSSAAQAVSAAREVVQVGSELLMHIGLHAGDVIHEENNIYGGAVNIASRVCALSAPGEILVSQTVRDLARTSAGVTFEDRGEHALKGIADPVRVFAVRAPG